MVILLILAVNFIVYGFSIYMGFDWLNPAPLDLYAIGGNLSPLSLATEKHLLLTSIFVHGGFFHLLINSMLFVQVGLMALKKMSQAFLFLVYIFSGVCGSLASALWTAYHPYSENMFASVFHFTGPQLKLLVSVGASGAILGLAAATFFVYFTSRIQDQEQDWKQAKQLLPVILINVAIGFFMDGVDNWAHIGGALSGLLMGCTYYFFSLRGKWILPYSFLTAALTLFVLLSFPLPSSTDEIATEIRNEIERNSEEKRKQEIKKKAQTHALLEEQVSPAAIPLEQTLQVFLNLNERVSDLFVTKNKESIYLSLSNKDTIIRYKYKTKSMDEIKIKGIKPSPCLLSRCPSPDGSDKIVVSEDEKWAVVSSPQKDEVRMIDLSSGQLRHTFSVKGFPRNLILNQDESLVFVFSSIDNTISVLDLVNRTVKSTLILGESNAAGQPYYRSLGMLLDRLNHRLYVLDDLQSQLVVFDSQALSKISSLPFPDESVGLYDLSLTQDTDFLWILTSQGLEKVDTKKMKIVDHYRYCTHYMKAFKGSLAGNDQYFLFMMTESQKLVAMSLSSRKVRRVFQWPNFQSDIFAYKSDVYLSFINGDQKSEIALMNWNQFASADQFTDENGEIMCFPEESEF